MHAGADHPRGLARAVRRRFVDSVRVEIGDALRLMQQPLRVGDGVVAPDQHAERVRFLGARVGGQGLVPGDLEGGDLVVGVVEQLVIGLSRRGELVERGVDGRVVRPRAAFDRVEVTVQRGFYRLCGGTYLGSGRLRSIRHSADAIRTGAGPAQ